ncbi:hypothetical protein Tdes44962_MAKER00237 [Teratosphaeria destructans]|uniref:Uncharacterized protein n=1 Tax=Teratosphaeria destructans TaxID=418781 RepID=A0A9W7W3X8_9PEZI|nr:hypothetical protein Tdes44962_MAKER00237 [Teratosphaeria destructans]
MTEDRQHRHAVVPAEQPPPGLLITEEPAADQQDGRGWFSTISAPLAPAGRGGEITSMPSLVLRCPVERTDGRGE